MPSGYSIYDLKCMKCNIGITCGHYLASPVKQNINTDHCDCQAVPDNHRQIVSQHETPAKTATNGH